MSSTTEILLQYVTHTQFATLGARVQEELRALYGRGAWSGYNVNLHSLTNEAVDALRGLEPPPAPQTPAVPRRRVVLNPEDTDSEDEWPAAPPGAPLPLGLAANLGPPQDTTEQNNALNYAQELAAADYIRGQDTAANYAAMALASNDLERPKLLQNARGLLELNGMRNSEWNRQVQSAILPAT